MNTIGKFLHLRKKWYIISTYCKNRHITTELFQITQIASIPPSSSIPIHIKQYICAVFSRPSCINASFLIKERQMNSDITLYKSCTLTTPSIDYDEVVEIFDILRNSKNKEIEVMLIILLLYLNISHFITFIYYNRS